MIDELKAKQTPPRRKEITTKLLILIFAKDILGKSNRSYLWFIKLRIFSDPTTEQIS